MNEITTKAFKAFSFTKEVQDVCKNYTKVDDQIGKSPLASLALRSILIDTPNFPKDLAGRATAIRQVIATQPSLVPIPQDKVDTLAGEVFLSLYCYIHGHDPYTKKEFSNITTYLESHYGIPASTYKNLRLPKGLRQLTTELIHYLASRTTSLEPIPEVHYFVGRNPELATYKTHLEQQRVVCIEGGGGMGKTMLGAKLTRLSPRPVCWLTLRSGVNNNFEDILWILAAFLGQHKRPQLWALLYTSVEKTIISTPQKITVLVQELAQFPLLLCIDNLDKMADEETVFWEMLHEIHEKTATQLLFISKRPLMQLPPSFSEVLAGLTSEAIKTWFAHEYPPMAELLTETQWEEVRLSAQGNPLTLKAWLTQIISRHKAGEKLDLEEEIKALNPLTTAKKVLEQLTPAQRRAAAVLWLSRLPLDSFLLEYGDIQLDKIQLRFDDFMALANQELVYEEARYQWSLSSWLEDYLRLYEPTIFPYYDYPEVMQLEWWLAHFHTQQGNALEAAYHFIQGRQADEAVTLLNEHYRFLVEQGHAMAILGLLKPLHPNELTDHQQLWWELQAKVWSLLGHYEEARKALSQAENVAKDQPGRAYLKRQQGKLKQLQGQMHQAKKAYRQARRILTLRGLTEETYLAHELAWVSQEQGQLDKAWREAQRAKILAEKTMGFILTRKGVYDQAAIHLQTAQDLAEEIGDQTELIKVLINYGVNFDYQNQFAEAIEKYQASLKIAAQIQDLYHEAINHLNIGIAYYGWGNYEAAVQAELAALTIFERLGAHKSCLNTHFSLAEAYLGANQLMEAQRHGKLALKLTQEVPELLDLLGDRAEALRVYAEIWLKRGQLKVALKYAAKALALLRWEDKYTEQATAASICETLTRIYRALKQTGKADYYRALGEQMLPEQS